MEEAGRGAAAGAARMFHGGASRRRRGWIFRRGGSRRRRGWIFRGGVSGETRTQVGGGGREPRAARRSYIATFFSFAAGDQVTYRGIAILASLLEIFAYGVADGAILLREDAIPVGYNVVFVIVNSYYVLRWVLNRSETLSMGLLEPTEAELFERCFEPLGVGAYQQTAARV